MDAIENMLTRKSVKKYKSTPVPKELIEKIYPYLIWTGYTTLYSKIIESVECNITLELDKYGNYKLVSYRVKEDAPIDDFIKEALEKDAVVE